MADSPPPTTRRDTQAPSLASLQARIAEMEADRERARADRRRNLLFVVLSLSLLAHIGLMYFLNSAYRYMPASGGPQTVAYEFAIITDEQLTEFEQVDFEDLMPESLDDLDAFPLDDTAAELQATVAAADIDLSAAGAAPVLGGIGSGEGGAPSLSGGGAGTSFFGISSRGNRFAYIVDISGSMRIEGRMETCMKELTRSVAALPDYAHFHILLFSTGFVEPPMQRGWMRSRRSTVASVTRWLEQVSPSGGTLPMSAFLHAFNLSTRPDVIFFLTDGEIPQGTADELAQLNQTGRKVVINTIAFGDPSSQEQLQRIAFNSGGVYRFVPTRGR